MSDSVVRDSDDDDIEPVEIQHLVDEIIVEGELEQYYNYIDYHFEKFGAYCRARTYLDEIGTVSVLGPFSDRQSIDVIEAPNLWEEVMAYLKRRFVIIQILGHEGYEDVWRHPGFEELKQTPLDPADDFP